MMERGISLPSTFVRTTGPSWTRFGIFRILPQACRLTFTLPRASNFAPETFQTQHCPNTNRCRVYRYNKTHPAPRVHVAPSGCAPLYTSFLRAVTPTSSMANTLQGIICAPFTGRLSSGSFWAHRPPCGKYAAYIGTYSPPPMPTHAPTPCLASPRPRLSPRDNHGDKKGRHWSGHPRL
jgi:hypothetical protein